MKAAELEKKLGKKKHKTASELRQIIATRPDHNPNFCLFLGAGASRSSGIRTAGEMVNEWRETVYKDLNCEGTEFSVNQMKQWLSANAGEWYDANREYASLIEQEFPLPANRRTFIEKEVSDKIPSIGYAYLVRLAEAGFLRTIFTTNFDDLLNEAFYQLSSERALVCAHDSSVNTISITSSRTKIIKLHGDYLFDNLKNTSTETNKLDANMREKLGEFLKEYGLIIAGYSGSDKSITRILADMADNPLCLKNGLFWCFREQDEITQDALDILERPKSFYVLASGFDELMADLYSMLKTDATPFNAKLASDRAANIIDAYLQNDHLKTTTSNTIKKHLEDLESDKHASLLSDLMKELNAERIASAGLTDKNLLVYLEIERALKDRNPEMALKRLDEELAKTVDRKFKDILLHRRFICSARLNKFTEAKATVKEMLLLEPANYYISLGECSLIENRVDRIAFLADLKTRHPFSAPVLNQYAEELREALEKHDKVQSGLRMTDVTEALAQSLAVYPSLNNPAWLELFNIRASEKSGPKVRESLGEIVDKHLEQDAFNSKTSAMLLRYCKKFKELNYKGKPLYEYLSTAYSQHFPRHYCAHLQVFVDACIEFNGHSLLRPVLVEAGQKEELKDDEQFAILTMDICYDVCRDLSRAISIGRDFLRTGKKISVEMKLVNFYLANKDVVKARDFHLKLKGAIEQWRWILLEAKILEYEGKFQDAMDAIESIPDRRDYKDRYTSILSYLDLKMAAPARAVKRCREFLAERSFALECEAEIINYEYGKQMDGRDIDKRRVAALADNTDSEMVKGVCYTLLGKDDDALKLFRQETEKRFSRIDDCLEWPAVTRINKQLQAMRNEFIKAKRSWAELSMS